jgi:Leucine-rich repeat (LRR) protein
MIISKDNINKFVKGTMMDCSNRGITYIEFIPEGVSLFYCYNNQLTKLPKLPNGITHLYCDNNELTELPILPNSLIGLYCDHNKLTKLPILPENLTSLHCWENDLPYRVTLKRFKEHDILSIKEHNTFLKRKKIINQILNEKH